MDLKEYKEAATDMKKDEKSENDSVGDIELVEIR